MKRAAPARAAVYYGLRGVTWLRAAANRVEAAIAGFAQAALHSDEMSAVTHLLYDAQPLRLDDAFPWERAWWSRAFPAPPARILVGGCGRGREVHALLRLGYEVWAFDPSLDSIRECQQRCPGAAFVGCFGYEALAETGRGQSPASAQWLPEGVSFDAVVMGWGSLSHVVDERQQCAVLEALSDLAPKGPVLASFLASREDGPTRGRSEALGFAVGRGLRRFRDMRSAEHDAHVRCLAHAGFIYRYSPLRLEELAAGCGRRLELDLTTKTPSAAFWPFA